MKNPSAFFFIFFLLSPMSLPPVNNEIVSPSVKIANGILEGMNVSGIHIFRGVPYAEPPIGDLRWREPQPLKNWPGVRKATKFGPRAMQPPIFSDMNFRSDDMSEDCLYLNVWTPAKADDEHLPVLVYFYGGGFVAGDGSEYRYDGESIARKGIVVVTVNYRLGIFGFLAHPELTKESPYHSSGNYGLLDQSAALRWVQQNIASFGGDPAKITIAGESAGSISVSALMASPLSKKNIAGAIGESGSLLGTLPPIPLAAAEQTGVEFAISIHSNSLAELRTLPAEKLLDAAARFGPFRFSSTIDGYFFPKNPLEIYEAGEQAHVPLLVGWNSEEMNGHTILGQNKPTVENFIENVQNLYGEHAAQILHVYHASADEEVEQVATDLAGDRFIGFSTWKWSDVHSRTSGKPVYRYMFSRPRPEMRSELGNASTGQGGSVTKDSAGAKILKPQAARGAVHSAEIEYALGNLSTNRVYDWQPEDYKVSEIMQTFFANFIKTSNPNGAGVPPWPAVNNAASVDVMHLDVNTRVVPETATVRQRYLLLDQFHGK